MKYPEPKYKPIPETQEHFKEAQSRLIVSDTEQYFRKTEEKERLDVEVGKAIICSKGQGVMYKDDCDSTCFDKGCKYLKECWGDKK